MRKAVLAVLLAVLLSACTSGTGIDVRPPDVQVDTPALREAKQRIGMEDCVPGDVELSALRGPLVINLGQAFCEPCRKEMPALEAFHQKYGDKVAVLGIDFNDVNPAGALRLAEDTKATYPSIADPGGELMAEETFAVARRGLPAFVFVDESGAVVGQASGGVHSVAEVKDLVAEHFGITL